MRTPMSRTFLWLLSCLASFSGAGCATILHGRSQSIEVFSEPAGATASVEGQSVRTPGVLRVPRKARAAEIRVEMEGYQTRVISLRRLTSGAVWWNLALIPAGVYGGAAVAAGAAGNDWFSYLEAIGYGSAAGGVGVTGIGFGLDYANGAAYRLEPARVAVRLEPVTPVAVAVPAGPD